MILKASEKGAFLLWLLKRQKMQQIQNVSTAMFYLLISGLSVRQSI